MSDERQVSTSENQTKISFHYHPLDISHNNHFIEKSENGQQRRYLKGVASGIKTDQHGERMTEKCIKSFNNQANSGQILLYPDPHGIRSSDDIGKLTKAEIQPDGNWEIESRLYDNYDFDDSELHKGKLATIDTLWRQTTGQRPYDKPIQKGFSVEGYIPPSGIIQMSNDGQRVIDDVLLDGVILVPRPAYQDGIANAVFKALGELPPWQELREHQNFDKNLREIVNTTETKHVYFKKKYELEDAFNNLVEGIMIDQKPNKEYRLATVFDDYKSLMISLLLKSKDVFQDEGSLQDMYETEEGQSEEKKVAMLRIHKSLTEQFDLLKKSLIRRRTKV